MKKLMPPTLDSLLEAFAVEAQRGKTHSDGCVATQDIARKFTRGNMEGARRLIRKKLEDGTWEYVGRVVRLGKLDGRPCYVPGFRPKRDAKRAEVRRP